MELLIKLFLSFFKIGMFSFGGGYAMLPLIKEEIIITHGWLSAADFIDVLAISEMTPGPIAINSATFLGYKIAGVLGAAVATIAVSLPSFIIITLIFLSLNKFKNSPYVKWIFKGIRPIVLGLIASAAISVATDSFIDIKSIFIALGLFYFVTFRKLNPIFAIVGAGVLGVILY